MVFQILIFLHNLFDTVYFKSPQIAVDAFCPYFIAVFTGKNRMECAYPTLLRARVETPQ